MTPVVFDLDGTLIDSLPDIAAAANALLEEEALPIRDPASYAGFVGHGEQVFMDRLIAATALQAQDRARLMTRFMGHYQAASRQSQLFPGVREVLQILKAAETPLGLCTNKPSAPLATVLQVTGLDALFDVVIAGDTLPQRKPDPAPLRQAFEELGATGIYVGDSEVDAQTAERVGVPFVLYTEGIRSVAAQDLPTAAVFSDFSDLVDCLKRLN